MFNFQHINNTLCIICTATTTSFIKFYALYSIEIFQSGLNCSFQKKWFFIITKSIKFIFFNIYIFIFNLKCLMFVEYNISGFNCSYQRKTFKNFITNTQYVFSNWDKIADDITDQFTISIQSIVNVINFSETKMFTKLYTTWTNFMCIVYTLLIVFLWNIYTMPIIIVFTINFIFMFFNKNNVFLFNKQTKIYRNIQKNYIFLHNLYRQFSKFK